MLGIKATSTLTGVQKARKVALGILKRSIGSLASVRSESLDRCANLLFRPNDLQRELRRLLPLRQTIVAGTLENRLLLIELKDPNWIVSHLGARPLRELKWPRALFTGVKLDNADDCVSVCEISPQALFRLTRPRIKLVSLCHRENFPLPRFPLCISDLARAVRCCLQGEVSLADMQLGATIPDLLAEIATEQPDIIGISATFGQHDLLEALADHLLDSEALLIFGGSLSALNAPLLLDRYPTSLVARGAGEETIRDIVEYWHGDGTLSAVRGIHWRSNGELKTSKLPANANTGGFLPELDLLEKTLECHGVMQLESSRGCTHACSFCPREHKGTWAGDEAETMDVVLDAVDEIFEEHSHVARKIFLVDEEFVGKDSEGDGLRRASAIAGELWCRSFRWETSSRVDQVYRPDRGKAWHLERMKFWTDLRDRGMDRCLFGIESGVDSVLKRFNKRISARQNALALRLLTASNIPIRCTYITYDHLMTFSELIESRQFQGRKDLLLRPQTSMSFDELFEAVHDDSFAAEHSRGTPFYSQITYMLVSMECLIGSPYLAKVQAAGLAREETPSMGRRNADFLDPRIGLMSECSQRWIDRNFSFDYLLKSLEKTTSGDEQLVLRNVRSLLKSYSYELLGEFLALNDCASSKEGCHRSLEYKDYIALMDVHFKHLVEDVDVLSKHLFESLRPDNWLVFSRELEIWNSRQSWAFINA
jgi:hypothetical protein